MIMVKLLE